MTANASESDVPDLGAKALEIAKRRQAAALEVVRMLEKQSEPADPADPETVLRAASWLAGTSLYRSFGHTEEPAPDRIRREEKANQEWPKLLKVFLVLIQKDGVKVTQDQLASTASAEHGQKERIVEIRQEFEEAFDEIMRKHGFDHAEGGRTGAVACAMLFKAYCVRRKDLDPELAAGIVRLGFIEGSSRGPLEGENHIMDE